MKPLTAQTADYWQNSFTVDDSLTDLLYSLIVEADAPLSIDELGLFVVRHLVEQERRSVQEELQQGQIYQTNKRYEVGQKVVFPQYDYALAEVVDNRPGYNPVDGDFRVIDVVFDGPGAQKASFATELTPPHQLDVDPIDQSESEDEDMSIQGIYEVHQTTIRNRLERRLKALDDLLVFNNVWFTADKFIEVQEGLLNIVDAAIDINGAPLNVDALIEQMDLSGTGKITDVHRFSVNYCLDRDDRFINVGNKNEVLWYLQRLMPPELVQVPARLRDEAPVTDIRTLDPEFLPLLAEIDDIDTPVTYLKNVDPAATSVQITLSYPYWRTGTLPVMPSVAELLSDESNPIVYLNLIDGQTGEPVSGWWLQDENYIAGLKAWYEQHQVPVGAFIVLRQTEKPFQFVIDLLPRRQQQEWIRAINIEQKRLAFQMKKKSLRCEYDALMVIDDATPEHTDKLYETLTESQTPLETLVKQIFPELLKLTSQGTVHIKTIYSAINAVRRCPPAHLLQVLSQNPAFTNIGHGYWTHKPS